MSYTTMDLRQQLQTMNTEIRNRGPLQVKAAMWQNALGGVGQSVESVSRANSGLNGFWADRVGEAFMYNALDVELTMSDWQVKIEENEPYKRLTEVGDQVQKAYDVVLASHDEAMALEAQIKAMQAEYDAIGPTGFGPRGAPPGAVNAGMLVVQIEEANRRILALQEAGGREMDALAKLYGTAATALQAASSGRNFAQLAGGGTGADAPRTTTAAGPGGDVPTGVAPDAPPADVPGAPPADVPGAPPANVPGAPPNAEQPGGVDSPSGADLPGGELPGGTELPGGGGPAGGTDLPNGAGLPEGGGPPAGATPDLGAAGLDRAAEPSLAGQVPVLPPATTPPPGPPAFPGGVTAPGPSAPVVPTVPPFVPPAFTPGAGAGTARPGLSPAALRALGGSGGGVALPGVSIGGPGSSGLPQAAVPVNAPVTPGVGTAPPPAQPLTSATPASTAGAVPPIVPPPMMGGAGAGAGGGSRPGSGAAARPPVGRGPAARPTPGLPALLSGKAGRAESFPARTRQARPEAETFPVPARSRPKRDRPADPAVAVQPVDEDLWRVDDTAARRQA